MVGLSVERLRLRAQVISAVRRFFVERGFLEVDTPLRVRSPGTEPHLEPLLVLGGPTGRERRYLVTSPELQMKQLLVAGSGPIFQIGHAFRGSELGPLHQTEFCLLEWYRPGTDYGGMMDDTEGLLRWLSLQPGLPGQVSWGGRSVDLRLPAERLSVAEAFVRATGSPPPDPCDPQQEERYFRLLVERVEPTLGVGRPTFLIDYPPCQASLARVRPGPPPVAERAELYLAGVELCNAFSELTDPLEQRRRIELEREQRREAGLPDLPADEDFLAALGRGMPHCGGNALGIDRLVMLLAGAEHLADVLPFPERT